MGSYGPWRWTLSSDRTAAYVHEVALMPRELVMHPSDGGGGGVGDGSFH